MRSRRRSAKQTKASVPEKTFKVIARGGRGPPPLAAPPLTPSRTARDLLARRGRTCPTRNEEAVEREGNGAAAKLASAVLRRGSAAFQQKQGNWCES